LKGSLDLTDDDLSDIVKAVVQSPCDNVLIAHGRYTMARTAKYIQQILGNATTKKVLLVGSLHPIKGFAPTDATFTLGMAIASFPQVTPGVHIVVKGRFFRPEEFTPQ